MRLYPDNPAEFEIVWYPARDDVPFLRGPNAINSLEWVGDRLDEFLNTDVGEVPGAPREYNPDRVNPLAIGGHTCGTREDFAGDGTYDPLPPFVVYRPDGLPLCCGALFLGGGGLAIGGAADVFGPTFGTGGLAIGGAALVAVGVVGTGGLSIGGTALVQPSGSITGTGGLAIGGTADVYGATFGTGGLAIGGTADVGPEPIIFTGDGGLVLGGDCLLFPVKVCSDTGNSCEGLPAGNLDEGCQWRSSDLERTWRRWEVDAGETYRFEIWYWPTSGSGITFRLWEGATCETKVMIFNGDGLQPYTVFDFTAVGPNVWFEPGIAIILPSGIGATRLTKIS